MTHRLDDCFLFAADDQRVADLVVDIMANRLPHHFGPGPTQEVRVRAERWIRTLKEQCLWVELHDTVDELRQAVARLVTTYNAQWLSG